MSEKLAISAALSVLMMIGYVLFGQDAARVPLGAEGLSSPLRVEAPTLPALDPIMPLLR
jgi:hypothetical protein